MEKKNRAGSMGVEFASLGFDEIVSAITERANTPGGQKRALASAQAVDVQEATRRLDETGAMLKLMERRPDFNIEPCEDVTGLLSKAIKSAILTGAQLRSFVPPLRTGASLVTIFKVEIDDEIDPIRSEIPSVPGFAELIDETIDEQGQVRPDATPGIERLYKALNGLRRSIRDRAENMLKDPKLAPMLQDDYVTVRDNRFVLPIKAERQSHVKGIVHDSSNSGQTFYIEPTQLVDLNNRLRTVEMELEDEIAKLLGELSAMVAGEAEAIGEIYSAICSLDQIMARARLAAEFNLTRPVFSDQLKLVNAAHPIMLLKNKNVVRNEISIPRGARALIVSGPNTGGKTVALATIGLTAVMAKSGLYIPAGEGSKLPFYNKIFADIGDNQSITDDLSTFSGHLKSINEIVRRAGAGSLALLDELMISTDPKEGSALAMAVVEKLVENGVDVVVTTHFSDLKVMAQTGDLYHNVSMEFDAERAIPTYLMIKGAPGESSALAVAEKLELDGSIIAGARRRLDGSDERIEKTLAELRNQKKALANAAREADKALAEAERNRADTEKARVEMETRRSEIAKTAKRKISGDIAEARRIINELVAEARGAKGSKAALKKSVEKLESITSDVRSSITPVERIARDELRAGDEVYLIPLERKGVLSSDPAGGKAEAVLGSIRMTVALSDLVGVRRGSEITPGDKRKTIRFKSTAGTDVSCEEELNIIGLRTDEAIEKVEKFLDSVFRGARDTIRIIHGSGTGALRTAVHEYLVSSPYISSYRLAEPNEGGEGATEVTLKKD
ncbi:MAG TPA: endonuclease MutS2 [Nitrospirae bacterium]|nr:endonuclease MutS2 [Nitrospirota bacterium]